LDDDEVGAERYRPAGVIKRDRPRPAVVTIDVGHPVQVSVVVDDVAFLKVKGPDRCGWHRASSRGGAAEVQSDVELDVTLSHT
jgi:hypothetical protein